MLSRKNQLDKFSPQQLAGILTKNLERASLSRSLALVRALSLSLFHSLTLTHSLSLKQVKELLVGELTLTVSDSSRSAYSLGSLESRKEF